jgi:putative lipoic acid-binding regulatory protein
MCKEFGGLGVPNLRDLNICLLASWLKRYNADRNKLWKEVVDFKYETLNLNVFLSRTSRSSSFFKGFMWAAQAAKMGYFWKVGNGRKIRFREDNWLGSSSFAIQFWPIYRIINEHGKSIAELWDGQNLKCTFRRNVNETLYNSWLELVELVSTVQLSEEEDEMVWKFSSKGTYSSQSLYKIINFRGIKQVHISPVWGIKIPPRVHMFL